MGINKKYIARPMLAYTRACAKPWKLALKVVNSDFIRGSLVMNFGMQQTIKGWEQGTCKLAFTEEEVERDTAMMVDSVLRDAERIVNKLTRMAEVAVGACDAMSNSLEELKAEAEVEFPVMAITYEDIKKEMEEQAPISGKMDIHEYHEKSDRMMGIWEELVDNPPPFGLDDAELLDWYKNTPEGQKKVRLRKEMEQLRKETEGFDFGDELPF